MQYLTTPVHSVDIGSIVEISVENGSTEFAKVIAIEKSKETISPNISFVNESFIRKVRENEYIPYLYDKTFANAKPLEVCDIICDKNNFDDFINDDLFIPYLRIKGITADIMQILEYLQLKETYSAKKVYSREDIIFYENDSAEMSIFGDDSQDIIKTFPHIRAAMFIENLTKDAVYFAYSQKGDNHISVLRQIGNCNFKTDDRWTLLYSPTENFFIKASNLSYSFSMESDWNAEFSKEDTI